MKINFKSIKDGMLTKLINLTMKDFKRERNNFKEFTKKIQKIMICIMAILIR